VGGRSMQGILRIGAAVAATVLLLVPAIWNGFPLLEYDTGGYLARWFEGTLVVSRSTVYGLFITALTHPNFWPTVLLQAAATVWVLALTLRALGFSERPWMLLAVTALLTALTTLPWIASVVLTDIFAGIAVLALYLLVFAPDRLRPWERWSLFGLLAFAASTHSATLALVLALVVVGAVTRAIWRIGAVAGIAQGMAAVVLGAVMLVTANFAVSGRVAWTPGGISLSFGRMLQDGIVARYLADHCPDTRLKLCPYRNELPRDADTFFWGGDTSVFNKLGRFAGLNDEMGVIVFGSLRDYPVWQFEAAAVAAAKQLFSLATGEGMEEFLAHTYGIIERYEPLLVADMRAARQQQGELDFTPFNRIHVPVALISMTLLIPLMAAGLRRERYAELGMLTATVGMALLVNAVVCGVFANPHHRYGARLAWLPPFVMLLAAWRLGELQQLAAGLPLSALRGEVKATTASG
jgi:hypothetical protein